MIIEAYYSHALCVVWAGSFSLLCMLNHHFQMAGGTQQNIQCTKVTKGRDLVVQPKNTSKTSNRPHGNAQAPHVAAKYPKGKLGKLQCSRFCAMRILVWTLLILLCCTFAWRLHKVTCLGKLEGSGKLLFHKWPLEISRVYSGFSWLSLSHELVRLYKWYVQHRPTPRFRAWIPLICHSSGGRPRPFRGKSARTEGAGAWSSGWHS